MFTGVYVVVVYAKFQYFCSSFKENNNNRNYEIITVIVTIICSRIEKIRKKM